LITTRGDLMKLVRFVAIFAIIGVLFAGCSFRKPLDPNKDPKLHIDYYDELTSLYGMERMAALKELGYEIQDTNVIHGFYIGIPLQVVCSGVTFDVYLSFDNEAMLSGVVYEKKYAYPEETELAIQDTLALAKLLEENLGEPAETDGWNDWYEEEYDTEMDPEPPTYKSADELRKLVDNSTGGGIMWWDMSDYICTTASEYKVMRYGDEAVCGFGLNFSADVEYAGEITVTISF